MSALNAVLVILAAAVALHGFLSAKRARRVEATLRGALDASLEAYAVAQSTLAARVKNERAAAVATSRRVLKGKLSEEMLPLLPGFPFQPSDCKFMGAPLDYVVFEGMSEEQITGIVLLEVKTGNASLNARQRQIKQCVAEGRVRFQEVTMEGVTNK